MIRKLIGFIFIICFQNTGFCDTISNWLEYHNAQLIDKFNAINPENKIVLNKLDFKIGDSITVKYFRDTPCFDCLSFLSVEDGKHHILTSWEGKGSFTPKKFSMDKLIESGKNYFEVWYQDDQIKSRNDRILLFRIKLE